MNCEETRRLMQEYATRELDPELRRRVDEHLVGCEDCRQESVLFALVVSSLDSQPVLEPRPGFSARVMAGLRKRQASLHPAWSLVLLPVLAVPSWVFRSELAAVLARASGRLLAGGGALPWPPRPTPGLPGLVTCAIALGIPALSVLGVWLYWREVEGG
jgi:anti-sigma factor RsiW